jgi:hypothetical protein
MVWPENFLRLHGLWIDFSSGSSPMVVTVSLGWTCVVRRRAHPRCPWLRSCLRVRVGSKGRWLAWVCPVSQRDMLQVVFEEV